MMSPYYVGGGVKQKMTLSDVGGGEVNGKVTE